MLSIDYMDAIYYTIKGISQPPLVLNTLIAKTVTSKVYKAIDPQYGTVAVKVTKFTREIVVARELVTLQKLQEAEAEAERKYYVKTFFSISSSISGISRLTTGISYNIDADVIVYVMEYIPDTLDEMEKTYKKQDYLITNDILKSYFTDLLRGLQFLHDKEIAHRDIKPANLVLSEGTVKYIDFGYACHAKDCTNTQSVGTTNFMAPEIMLHLAHRTLTDWKQADIYSLGLTFISIMSNGLRVGSFIKAKTIKDTSAMYSDPLRAKATMDSFYLQAIGLPEHAVFNDLIRSMTDLNPKKRVTVSEALDMLS